MALILYNTLSRKKEIFKPIEDKKAGLYSCGPTVYWYQHIGNLRAYIFVDTLKRILKYDGYKIKHVMNVTDVGHLTGDTDTGKDKIEEAAKKEGKKAEEIANFYWNVFREDLKKLNISEPDIWPKATEHIKEQIELIKKLEEKKYTYRTADGIYFDTSKLKDYGKLARLKKTELAAGKRVAMKEKKNPTDFALWKFSPVPSLSKEKRQQEWESPWGIGFPGWHIECSAMSMKYLGNAFENGNFHGERSRTIDIHTGGIDHISVHHTNEIAQSEAATGTKFVNFWLHNEFLTYKGEKVSKSTGGLYIISELEEQGFNPLAYRYLCLGGHYRKSLEFSLEALKNTQNSYERLKNIVRELKDDGKINKKYLADFEKAINNDLDTPKALATLWRFLRDRKAQGKVKTIAKIDEIFGLDLLKKEKIEIPAEITELAEQREKARRQKDWQKADELRQKIAELGWLVKDTAKGPTIKKKI